MNPMESKDYHVVQQLQQPLGKNAGRQTWLADDLQTQTQVVIKLLQFGDEFEWDNLKLFEREAETLRSLEHPAIPRYLDYFELDAPQGKGFALVQTYIEARSLEQQLQAGRSFSEAEVKQLARALLEILSYLHDRQPPVIHRDLKPSNILLTNRSGNTPGQVYLVDFGSVQTALKVGGTLTIVGTYGYMPPEQFGGRATAASDLYSLGATLIYLVTGQHPADLPQDDLRIAFEQAVTLSPDFVSWLQWLTEPSLKRRASSAQAALDALVHGQLQHSSALAQSHVHRQIYKKPTVTRSKLAKTATSLTVCIPPWGANISYVVSWLVFLILSSLLCAETLALIVSQLIYPTSYFLWDIKLLMVVCSFLTCLLSVRRLFSAVSQRLQIHCDSQRVLLKYQYLGKPRLVTIPRHQISRVTTTDRETNQARLLNKVTTNCLWLWSGNKPYLLASAGTFSPEELNWVASELGAWLKVPVER